MLDSCQAPQINCGPTPTLPVKALWVACISTFRGCVRAPYVGRQDIPPLPAGNDPLHLTHAPVKIIWEPQFPSYQAVGKDSNDINVTSFIISLSQFQKSLPQFPEVVFIFVLFIFCSHWAVLLFYLQIHYFSPLCLFHSAVKVIHQASCFGYCVFHF